ncbi:MAG: DUF2628 domain-containing protein [bacterium]|nr:DUF2628 domain-containing protein [bacterium]
MDKDNSTLEELKPYFEDLKNSGEKEINYYERRLPQHAENPDRWVWSWNWPAALFSSTWMIYRKMYWQAAVLILVGSILDALTQNTFPPLKVISFILLGGFGNALYYRDIQDRIGQGHRRKGVHGWLALIFIILSIIVALALFIHELDLNLIP